MAQWSVLALVLCLASFVGGCNDDAPKVTPNPRDVNRVVAAVSDAVYQCAAAEAGFTSRADTRSVDRDVEVLVDAWDRLRADSRFDTATGTTTLREQSRIAVRRLDNGCAPRQAARLREAAEK
jgi:hypothetical protein